MMAVFKILVIGLLMAIVNCEVCPTCYNTECSEESISELSCTGFTIPSLPYGFQTRGINSVKANYACIDLEYVDGEAVEQRKQCVVLEDHEDICSDIQSHLADTITLKKCTVSATKYSMIDELLGENLLAVKNVQAVDDEEEDEGSGGEPISTTPQPDAASTTTVTISLFIVAILSQIVKQRLQC